MREAMGINGVRLERFSYLVIRFALSASGSKGNLFRPRWLTILNRIGETTICSGIKVIGSLSVSDVITASLQQKEPLIQDDRKGYVDI